MAQVSFKCQHHRLMHPLLPVGLAAEKCKHGGMPEGCSVLNNELIFSAKKHHGLHHILHLMKMQH